LVRTDRIAFAKWTSSHIAATAFPRIVIQQAVWLYFCFALSYRDVEDMLAERGIDVSYDPSVAGWSTKPLPELGFGISADGADAKNSHVFWLGEGSDLLRVLDADACSISQRMAPDRFVLSALAAKKPSHWTLCA